jgi:nitroreductase
MDAIEALKQRHSVRSYLDKPIERKTLEDLVDCARLAATAINIQPWEFVVITDRARLAALAALTDYGRFIASAAACVAVLCRDTKYYLEDGSAATENLLLAATAYGLGSCWVAGDKKPYASRALEFLGAPADFKLVSLVALGHPAEDLRRDKRPLKDVLHWERL